jgi:methionyl-tRNA formyltransferase
MVRRAAAGEIIAQEEVAVADDQDIYGLTMQLLDLAPNFLEQTLQAIFSDRARTRLPDLSSSTFVRNRHEGDGVIDWRQSARHIYNIVRAEAPPWPGAVALLQGERCWLNAAEVRDERGKFGPPGLVLADGTIACGQGRLEPTGLFSLWANPIRPTAGTLFDVIE